MRRTIQPQYAVDEDAPFVVATFLNEGAEGTKHIRDEALRRSIKVSRVTAAKQREVDQLASLIQVVNLTEADREELGTVVDMWLDTEGDWPRFVVAMLKQGQSVKCYTDFPVHRWANGVTTAHSSKDTSAAQGLMLQLIEHPESWRLAGKCADCGRYMLRTTRAAKKYCNAICKGRALVVKPKGENREKVKARKLAHLKKAAEKWVSSTTRESCIDFILREATAAWRHDLEKREWSDISVAGDDSVGKSSLTRWRTKGLLTIPTEKEGRRA